MDFQVGDQVVLPAHGVGQIVQLEERNFLDQNLCWYYQIATARSTIWVAVANHETTGLRPVAASDDIVTCCQILQADSAPLNSDHNQRRTELKRRLRTGSLASLCEVVRDLTVLSWRRPLAEADAALLRQARDNLLEEWAAARGITNEEAGSQIDDILQSKRPPSAAKKPS